MLAHPRIALIGAGTIAEAILAGLLHEGQLTPTQFIASDIVHARRADFTWTYAVRRTDDFDGRHNVDITQDAQKFRPARP